MPVTAKDIAKATSFSIPTVYEALRGSGRMRDTSRQTILKAAEKLGYRPSRTAVNMRKGLHRAIGLPLYFWHSLPQQVLLTIMAELQKHDQLLLCEYLHGREPDYIPRILSEDCLDGLLTLEDLSPAIEAYVTRHCIPVVQINTNRRKDPACITFDEESAVREMVRLLAERGRKHIAYLCPSGHSTHYSRKDRWRFLKRFAKEAGLAPPIECRGHQIWNRSVRETDLLEFFTKHSEIDAVICYADILAPLITHVGHIVKRRVPTKISLMTFNDTSFARSAEPKIASMAIPPEDLAKTAVDMMLAYINTGKAPPPVTLQYQLIRDLSI